MLFIMRLSQSAKTSSKHSTASHNIYQAQYLAKKYMH